MVHISKHKVRDDIQKQMDTHLADLFLLRLSKKQITTVFSEILTPAERTVLLKRVAAIGMLANKHSIQDVARTLQLSTSTVQQFKNRMHKKQYPTLWKMYHKIDSSFFDFLSPSSRVRSRARRADFQKESINPLA